MIVAISSKQWKIVQILIASGADLKLADIEARTPYDLAVEEKAPDYILDFLNPQTTGTHRVTTSNGNGKHHQQPTPFTSVVFGNQPGESISVSLREDV